VLGGGEYFIARLLGFARGLRSAGVPYDLADVIVGTSAGAIVGSAWPARLPPRSPRFALRSRVYR
jgi:predicted acylesterase/phospholipase RssA